jgi:hypothetical protein
MPSQRLGPTCHNKDKGIKELTVEPQLWEWHGQAFSFSLLLIPDPGFKEKI